MASVYVRVVPIDEDKKVHKQTVLDSGHVVIDFDKNSKLIGFECREAYGVSIDGEVVLE